jgi:hypothetical protein
MADEKIRLVLSTDGVQDIKALEQRFEELAQAMGLSDYAFENVTDKAEKTKKKVKELDDTLGEAAGEKTGKGRGLGGFAYAMQDLAQGGFPAILNNVQQLVTGVGLGAGLAGALQLAGVGIFVFGEKLIKLSGIIDESVKPKLGEVSDELIRQTAEVKRLKEEYDKLIESEDTSFANRSKLRNVTEDLADAEKRLADEKAAQKAGKEADENVGMIEAERVKKQQESFKEKYVDTGELKNLKKEMLSNLSKQQPQFSEDEAALAGLKMSDEFTMRNAGKSGKAREDAARDMLAVAKPYERERYIQQGKATAMAATDKEQQETVNDILARMQNAKTIDDINKAYQDMAAIVPEQAAQLRDYHIQKLQSDEADKAVEDSIEKMKESRIVREKKAAAQTQAFARMGRMLATGQRVEEAAEKKAERDDKANEKLAEREEKKRVEIRDRAMDRMGVTPEGLAVQRQNAAVGTSRSAQVARQNTGQQQEQALLAKFQNDGMTAEQAKKTTEEIKEIGTDIVRTMMRTGEMDLTMFKQLQLTARGQEMSRLRAMQEMQAGNRKPGFQGGMRSN